MVDSLSPNAMLYICLPRIQSERTKLQAVRHKTRQIHYVFRSFLHVFHS